MKGFFLLALLSLFVLCFIQSTVAEESVQEVPGKQEVNVVDENMEDIELKNKQKKEEMDKRLEEMKERSLRFEKDAQEERAKRLKKFEEEQVELDRRMAEGIPEPNRERKKIDPEALEKLRNEHFKGLEQKREMTKEEEIEADAKRFADIEEVMKKNGKTDEEIQRIREVMINKRKTHRKNRDEL